jgi:PhzF family phenazine biosynthesis protein
MIIHHVDAFTSRPFAGNPAAVCLLDEEREAAWMHALAAELNLPKTAFARRAASGRFHLRWFGVDGESQLCGHATLASAHVLWDLGEVAAGEEISFLTCSGELRARQLGDGWIEIDFPAEVAAREERPILAAALGVEPLWMGRNRLHFLVEVASEEIVRALRPDFRRLAAALPPASGVMVTARATPAAAPAGGGIGEGGACDFVSRYFAPLAGMDEDPATGSAHCALGPYWSAKLGKTELLAYQASARGGWLRVSAAGPRVRVAGQAVSVLRGELAAGSAS